MLASLIKCSLRDGVPEVKWDDVSVRFAAFALSIY